MREGGRMGTACLPATPHAPAGCGPRYGTDRFARFPARHFRHIVPILRKLPRENCTGKRSWKYLAKCRMCREPAGHSGQMYPDLRNVLQEFCTEKDPGNGHEVPGVPGLAPPPPCQGGPGKIKNFKGGVTRQPPSPELSNARFPAAVRPAPRVELPV